MMDAELAHHALNIRIRRHLVCDLEEGTCRFVDVVWAKYEVEGHII